MQKTNEMRLEGQSDTGVGVSVGGHSISSPGGAGWQRGQAGPRAWWRRGPDDTTVVWDQTRRGMKGEAPGDQTVTSHKALFTKDTHSLLHPLNASVHQSPTLPKCQGRDLGDSVNSTPRLVGRGHKQRAERGEKGREVERLRLRGEKSGDWMVQYVRPILIGDCSAMSCFSWESVRGGQEGGEVRLFPKVLNSGINHRGETQ